jgi:hypothetical protein
MFKLNSSLAAVGAAALMVWAASPAEARTCINKAGQGTNSTEEGAKFQAYEAILQATDWGMWASWMATSQKVGVAPGYQVTRLKSKCSKGGMGSSCVIQATLCK